jgi:superfamily II DNA or RNA helicase
LAKPAKANLLDHFYEHLSENEWLEGVDIYQAGKVTNVQVYDGLITAKVASMLRDSAEVRLKIHPAGHCIQWIECTCRKNRTLGYYCEHIAAFMLHIDREKPDLIANLDSTMPLKPPASPKRRVAASEVKAEQKAKSADATGALIDHLKGNIQSVSLLANGPGIRVRIEIKPGHLTHYDLTTDNAARFLQEQKNLPLKSGTLQDIKVFRQPAIAASRITQLEEEKVIADRGIALPAEKEILARLEHFEKLHCEQGIYRLVVPTGAEDKPREYVFFPQKAVAKYLGSEFFFLPGTGYFPLERSALTTAWADIPLTKTYSEDAAAEFVSGGYADYLAAGPVLLDPDLSTGGIEDIPELTSIEIIESGEGWFRLDPRYGKGKGAVSMASLMRQHKKQRRKYIKAGNHWMRIPEFITEHDWELDETGEAIKVDALGLMRIKAAIGDFDQFVGSKKVLNQLRSRFEFEPESEMPVEHGTRINLRVYQSNGLKWLWWLYKNGLHGLLADEMGLGKTHQAMALMAAIQKEKPDARFLVICPTTVLDHWLDKMEEFAPALKPMKYHGPKRTSGLTDFKRHHHTLLTSYGVVLRDIRHLNEHEWDAVILDEAHLVKNNDTATYQSVCKLRGKIRICLTGTPIENHLGELKNIFDFLVPGYLGSDEYFKRNFISPMDKSESPETTLALQKLIHPFKMRRTKENVLPDLPAKVEDLRHCALSDEQVKLYRDVLAIKARPLIEKLQDDASPIPFLHVFATLTLLKQICDHPALVQGKDSWKKHESGKFELLKELLEEALGSGHKIVIFSQYVGMIDIISQYLKDQGIRHGVLTGQTRNRGELIKEFQIDPEMKVFCGSLLAGGIGIDLTAASVVVHYDRWWNASKENQATDRVHRIGQNKNVQVLKLVTRGTLEEKIDRMISAKRELFEKFMDKDEEIFQSLSRQELIDLLQ